MTSQNPTHLTTFIAVLLVFEWFRGAKSPSPAGCCCDGGGNRLQSVTARAGVPTRDHTRGPRNLELRIAALFAFREEFGVWGAYYVVYVDIPLVCRLFSR